MATVERPEGFRFPRWVWRIAVSVAVIVIVAALIVLLVKMPAPRKPDGDVWDKALVKLETLAVKGPAHKTGYSRDAFLPPWTDDVNVPGGHNGCDTRDDILRRDLTNPTLKGCAALSGTLNDPYTGTTIPIHSVQIDHVVALEDAWQTGAQQLDPQTRQTFANDPRNLQATSGRAKRQKRHRDAATWLPPNKAYRCTYVARQVDVKALYGLWVTPAEHDAIKRLLRDCAEKEPSTSIGATTPGPAPIPRALQKRRRGPRCWQNQHPEG